MGPMRLSAGENSQRADLRATTRIVGKAAARSSPGLRPGVGCHSVWQRLAMWWPTPGRSPGLGACHPLSEAQRGVCATLGACSGMYRTDNPSI